MPRLREDKSLQLDFQAISRHIAWPSVRNAMLIRAQQCVDPMVRVGWMDALGYFDRQVTRATEKDNKSEEQE